MAAVEGSAFALARWFAPERYVNRPEDDFVREEVLTEIWNAEAVATSREAGGKVTVWVRTPNGAAAIETRLVDESPLVVFDFVRNDRWERTNFWMNPSSVAVLGARLRNVPRVTADEIFVGAAT